MADDPRPDNPSNVPAPADSTATPAVQELAPPIARASDPTRITPRSPRARLEPERVPPPARPSRRARHPIVVIGNGVFTTIIILAIVIGGGLAIGKQRFETPGPLEQEKIVNIPRGGVQDVADVLVREGVIDQKWVFIGGVFALKARDELKSGEYRFARHATLRDIVDTLVEGKVVPHFVTIPEGLTSEQIVARLLENDVLTGNLREIPPEGTLLPETYKFNRGDTREQLIQRMQQAHKRVVQEAWERRSPDLPLKSPEQLVVLASIVEKETSKAEERTRVAAVFVNRLRQRMKLQSDPTIIYGLVGGKGTLGRPISRSDKEQPTPYNTYVIEGLPPRPIANPGRASIEATANPSRTKELYFVADGTGGHTFSETLDQHQRGVTRLRQFEKEAREAASGTQGSQDPQMPAFAPVAPQETTAPLTPPGPAGAGPPSPTARPSRAQGASTPRGTRQQ